jgi:dTDP-4-amino-4,6-dideoxygalactose transaminase
MKIPFSPPFINQQIIDEVTDALKSGWITTGPKTKQFEREIAAYCQVPKVLCLNSATAGLEIMLRWFGVKEGDEVIVPAYTYAATANVVLHCGATPIMVDVRQDFLIDVNAIEKAITHRTKAIIPVDIFGYPCDFDEIKALVSRQDIRAKFSAGNSIQEKFGRIIIIDDAAHSVGAEYKGKKVGSQADVVVFSFHAVKNLTTAEGGAICLAFEDYFDVEDVYRQLNIKCLHGQTKDAMSKTQSGGWRYDVIEAGYKFNMPDLLAAVGLATIKVYESDIIPRRREIFERYCDGFQKFDWAQLPEYFSKDKISSYHVFPLRINGISEIERDEIIEQMTGAGIATNVHFQPLPLLSLYKNLGYKMDDYPISYDNYSREISLPVYPQLSNFDVDAVISTLSGIVEKYA